jgi:hypothetical protein
MLLESEMIIKISPLTFGDSAENNTNNNNPNTGFWEMQYIHQMVSKSHFQLLNWQLCLMW